MDDLKRSLSVCLFVKDQIVLSEAGSRLPSERTIEKWLGPAQPLFEFRQEGQVALAGEAPEDWSPGPEATQVSIRTALSSLDAIELPLALTAAHLLRWRRTSKFCGACGHPTEEGEGGKAFRCSACGHMMFPKVSPAIIVQVSRGNEILLGRSTRHPPGFYSVLAGFVDPGESLEEAVHREIKEESGISVKNVSYFGSQPWPFPDSLMVGFTAEYAEGDIRTDDDEIEEVHWFPANALPPVPPTYSIARGLIDDFVSKHGVDPADVPTWHPGYTKR